MRTDRARVEQVWAEVVDHLAPDNRALVTVTEWANNLGVDVRVDAGHFSQTLSITSDVADALCALLASLRVTSPDDDA